MFLRKVLDFFIRNKYIKILWLFLFIVIIAIFCYYRYTGELSDATIMNYITKHNNMAPVLYLTLFTLFSILIFPTFPLTISAGLIWGPYLGIAYATLGYAFGTTIGFIISRYFAHSYIKNKLKFRSLDWLMKQVEKRGWKVVALARLTSVFPVGFFNYFFGVSSINFKEYAIASNVFILPTTVAYVVFGYSISGMLFSGNKKFWIIGGTAFAIIIISTILIRKFLKKRFPDSIIRR